MCDQLSPPLHNQLVSTHAYDKVYQALSLLSGERLGTRPGIYHRICTQHLEVLTQDTTACPTFAGMMPVMCFVFG